MKTVLIFALFAMIGQSWGKLGTLTWMICPRCSHKLLEAEHGHQHGCKQNGEGEVWGCVNALLVVQLWGERQVFGVKSVNRPWFAIDSNFDSRFLNKSNDTKLVWIYLLNHEANEWANLLNFGTHSVCLLAALLNHN